MFLLTVVAQQWYYTLQYIIIVYGWFKVDLDFNFLQMNICATITKLSFLIERICGIFVQHKNCGARETAIAR
jgi:hypothetical protein